MGKKGGGAGGGVQEWEVKEVMGGWEQVGCEEKRAENERGGKGCSAEEKKIILGGRGGAEWTMPCFDPVVGGKKDQGPVKKEKKNFKGGGEKASRTQSLPQKKKKTDGHSVCCI